MKYSQCIRASIPISTLYKLDTAKKATRNPREQSKNIRKYSKKYLNARVLYECPCSRDQIRIERSYIKQTLERIKRVSYMNIYDNNKLKQITRAVKTKDMIVMNPWILNGIKIRNFVSICPSVHCMTKNDFRSLSSIFLLKKKNISSSLLSKDIFSKKKNYNNESIKKYSQMFITKIILEKVYMKGNTKGTPPNCRTKFDLIQKLLRTAIREDLRGHGIYPYLPLIPVSRLA